MSGTERCGTKILEQVSCKSSGVNSGGKHFRSKEEGGKCVLTNGTSCGDINIMQLNGNSTTNGVLSINVTDARRPPEIILSPANANEKIESVNSATGLYSVNHVLPTEHSKSSIDLVTKFANSTATRQFFP